MFTKLLTLSLLLTSIACTKKASDGSSGVLPEASPEIIESQSIVLDSNDELDNEPILFKITTEDGASSRKRLYIRNETGETLTLADISSQLADTENQFGSEFSLVRNRCGTTLSVGRSCYMDIEVSGSNVSDKSGLVLYLIDERSDNLSDPFILINIEVDETYANEESSEDSLIKSTEIINFGTLTVGKDAKRRIYFSNTNKFVSIAKPIIPGLPTGVSAIDSCPAELEALSSCYVDFIYSHQASGNLTLSETVQFSAPQLAAKNLTFEGVSVATPDPNSAKLSVSAINVPTTTVAGREYVDRIYLSNTSETSVTISSGEIISGATILKNTCATTLKAGQYCYIDISNIPTQNNQSFPPVVADIPEANVESVVIRPGSNEGGGESCTDLTDDESCQSSEIAGGCAWDYDYANEGANQSCQAAPSCSDILDQESCGGAEIGIGCFWDYDYANEGANQTCKSRTELPTCDEITVESSCAGAEIGSGCKWAEVSGVTGQTGYCYPRLSLSSCSSGTDASSCSAIDPGVGICLFDTAIPGGCFHTETASKDAAEASTSGFNGSSIREPSFGGFSSRDAGNRTFWSANTENPGDGDELLVVFWNGTTIYFQPYGTEAGVNSLTSVTVGDYTYYRENVIEDTPRYTDYSVYRIDNTRSEPVDTGSGGSGGSGGEEGGGSGGGEE